MTKTQKRLIVGIGSASVIVAILLEAFVHDPHHDEPGWTTYWYHHFPGYNAVLGFVVCVAIVAVSKGLGLGLQKPKDYYDE
jgi:hypothetical protein